MDALDERILNVTRDLVAENGVRLTIDDIAKRARVNRTTVFRRYGTKESVLDEMYAREIAAGFERIRAAIGDAPDERAAVVEMVATALDVARTHPIARRFLQVDPRLVLDLLARGEPPVVSQLRTLFAQQIRAAQHDVPTSEKANPAELADALVHLILGYALIRDEVAELDDERKRRAFTISLVIPLLRARGPEADFRALRARS